MANKWNHPFTRQHNTTIPMSFSTTNYVVAESRYGGNVHDATGHFTKYTYGISINPENEHITDFIFIGY